MCVCMYVCEHACFVCDMCSFLLAITLQLMVSFHNIIVIIGILVYNASAAT